MQKKRKHKASWCDFTIIESINWAAHLLQEMGCDTARLDAELLLQHVLKKNRLEIYLARNELHNQKTLRAFFSLVKRRLCHEPVAYIVGQKEFFGFQLVVSPACLIPRPDTEIAVEECLKVIETNSDAVIVDMCTGSGAIALSILRERPKVKAIATDISNDALKIARINAKHLQVSERLTLLKGDLFAALKPQSKASLIVANPPYIRRTDMATLAKTVRDFEPHSALDGDDDGLAFYRRIIVEAESFLLPNGYLILEIGFDQAAEISKMVDATWSTPKIVKDLGQRDRCIVLQLRTRDESLAAPRVKPFGNLCSAL